MPVPHTWIDINEDPTRAFIRAAILNSEFRDIPKYIKEHQRPIGAVMEWGESSPPASHLFCDGAAISRTTYQKLFALIGTRYGVGDGSATFNLPDLRGRIPIGRSATYVLSTTGGAATVTLLVANLAIHSHDHGEHTHQTTSVNFNCTVAFGADNFNSLSSAEFAEDFAETGLDSGGTVGSVGGGVAVDILNSHISVHYIIRAL